MLRKFFLRTFAALLLLTAVTSSAVAEDPSFSLAWSEYPSWSVFGVASETVTGGVPIIDKRKGERGYVERLWDVDLVLRQADYDPCLSLYATGQVDAVCITNMDILPYALGRKSVAVCPTSTSFGADATIVTSNIQTIDDLRGVKTYGLVMTVSQYMQDRNLVLAGENPFQFKMSNMDPAEALKAFIIDLQAGSKDHQAIAVWNPFVNTALTEGGDKVHVLFDSTSIPGEIIDMVVFSAESLESVEGQRAACAVIHAFYLVSMRLASEDTRTETSDALGDKFSNLAGEEMFKCLYQTRFFATADQGIGLYDGSSVAFPWKEEVDNPAHLFTNSGWDPSATDVTDKKLTDVMPLVVDFCEEQEIIPEKPRIGYGQGNNGANLVFDSRFMKRVRDRMTEK